MVVSFYLGCRWLGWLALVSLAGATAAVVGLMAASEARAMAPPRPFENRGLAIVNKGVLRFDEGALFLEASGSVITPLGATGSFQAEFSASPTATAALIEGERPGTEPHFVVSVLPRALSAIGQPPRLSGGGCTWWEPSRPYVVVEDDLVAAGECQQATEHPVREPLFVRNLHGGRWRVLRWFLGASVPELAAEGSLLAAGVARVGQQMTVSILNVPTGGTQASFETPVGQLAFASPQRLVLEIPISSASQSGRPTVSLRLYTSRGNYLADLGSMTEPLISDMHIAAYENGTLSVTSVAGGASRSVVGFNPPARALESFALRWPDLVVSETTSTPLLPSEVGCWSGSYGRPSKPFLATFDLARAEPLDAPPATVHVEPATPLTDCGPAPP